MVLTIYMDETRYHILVCSSHLFVITASYFTYDAEDPDMHIRMRHTLGFTRQCIEFSGPAQMVNNVTTAAFSTTECVTSYCSDVYDQ